MPGTTAKLLVAVEGQQAVIRPCGRASFTCSADFKRLVYELVDSGCRDFILELSGCTIMDSTFLGILVRFASTLDEKNEGSEKKMALWNASPRIVDLVTSLGMLDFFRVEQGPLPEWTSTGEMEATVCEGDKVESTKVALEAHEALMEANPENVDRFKDVTRFLAEDLKRMRNQESGDEPSV